MLFPLCPTPSRLEAPSTLGVGEGYTGNVFCVTEPTRLLLPVRPQAPQADPCFSGHSGAAGPPQPV